jgi:hypothetical protein
VDARYAILLLHDILPTPQAADPACGVFSFSSQASGNCAFE